LESLADQNFRTVEQPLKIPFIAAIVLLANVQKPEFTAEILQKVGNALQKRLDTGSWREVKLYLRFLGCLQGLFENEGVFIILEDLFSRAVDLQTQSSEDVSSLLSRTATS
jgi:nuclear cap-binding protein subunit 1